MKNLKLRNSLAGLKPELRLALPSKEQYVTDVFGPVFLLLMEFVECTGGEEEWDKFTAEQKEMLAAHAVAPLGTAFPAELRVSLHGKHGGRIGEG